MSIDNTDTHATIDPEQVGLSDVVIDGDRLHIVDAIRKPVPGYDEPWRFTTTYVNEDGQLATGHLSYWDDDAVHVAR